MSPRLPCSKTQAKQDAKPEGKYSAASRISEPGAEEAFLGPGGASSAEGRMVQV